MPDIEVKQYETSHGANYQECLHNIQNFQISKYIISA